MKHPLFSEARREFLNALDHQIIKGSETYEEPLNPHSWTPKQLYNHAIEELADNLNYTKALLILAETAADEPNELLEEIFDDLSHYNPDMVEETIMSIRRKINEHFNGKLIPKGGE